MPKFKNVSPYGDLDLPLVGRVIEFGEIFEVTDRQAKGLEGQLFHWEPVDAPATAPTIVELKAALTDAGLPTDGKKADLATRLAEHLTTSAASTDPMGDPA